MVPLQRRSFCEEKAEDQTQTRSPLFLSRNALIGNIAQRERSRWAMFHQRIVVISFPTADAFTQPEAAKKRACDLPMIGPQLFKDLAALDVNEAKTGGIGRPLNFPSGADCRSRIPRRNLDIVKRSPLSEVANAKFMSLVSHS
jgi:hypothetical protein